MEKKYLLMPVVLIMFIASCSFTKVEQGQNGLEDQEVMSSEVTLSEPKAELSRTLVIYSGRKESLVSEIISEFVHTSGVKVDVRYANSAELSGTLILEGMNSPADIFFSQDPISLGKVAKEGLFDQLPLNILENVPNWAIDKNNYWVGTSGRSRSLVIDVRDVEESELPNDIYGLADEKFRNRLGLAPTNSSFIAMVACMIELDGEEKVLNWLTKINGLGYGEYPNNSPQVASVAAGELDIGMINHYYTLRILAENGDEPIKNVYLDDGCGAMVMPAGIGILSSSQNKPEALAFIEFLHSKSVQEIFTNKIYEFPLVVGIQPNALLPDINSLNTPPNLDWSALSFWQEKAVELIVQAGF
tara:strand:- start:648 stop:1724 length:1077 start_codon:yes stop_codon:yes gene_type:complete